MVQPETYNTIILYVSGSIKCNNVKEVYDAIVPRQNKEKTVTKTVLH